MAVVEQVQFAPETLSGDWHIVLADPTDHWVALERDGAHFGDEIEESTGRCYSLRVVSTEIGGGERWFPDDASLRALPVPTVDAGSDPASAQPAEDENCNAEGNTAVDRVDVMDEGTDFDRGFAFGVVEDGWSLVGVRGPRGITGLSSGSRFVVRLPAPSDRVSEWVIRDPSGRTWTCEARPHDAPGEPLSPCASFKLDPGALEG